MTNQKQKSTAAKANPKSIPLPKWWAGLKLEPSAEGAAITPALPGAVPGGRNATPGRQAEGAAA